MSQTDRAHNQALAQRRMLNENVIGYFDGEAQDFSTVWAGEKARSGDSFGHLFEKREAAAQRIVLNRKVQVAIT